MIGGGRLCFQRMWGDMLLQTICKKSSAKAAVADNRGQTPRGSSVRHAVFAVADFATLFGDVRESCFLI